MQRIETPYWVATVSRIGLTTFRDTQRIEAAPTAGDFPRGV